ncbi:hypothetical protein ABZP36_032929 [Zizania latifolia]
MEYMVGVTAVDSPGGGGGVGRPSRYESQKRRDWQTFGQYLRNHRPPLELARCSGAHVLEFLRYLDQFGKTKQRPKQKKHQDQPPADSAAVGPSPAPADVLQQVPETTAHFLIPHAHFLHGHYFLAPGADQAAGDDVTAAQLAHAPVAGGDDLVLAMAAAAGCLMPLSVFN